MIRKLINAVMKPQNIFFKTWKKFPVGDFRLRLDYDIFPRPHYAFCVYHAARQAHALGLDRISVMEFGVAGGNGLIELERLAMAVEQEFPVAIDVYGFDTGTGLPAPVDYRDLPYIWREGFFAMDENALRGRLGRARLVLGDVKETVPDFFNAHGAAPLGAAFFDLDFWSSTNDALGIFDADEDKRLPRALCYFDDVLSAEGGGWMNEYIGQLASIRDYNESHQQKKISKIEGFDIQRRMPAPWNSKIYVHHDFQHAKYNTYIHADKDRQLGIAGAGQ